MKKTLLVATTDRGIDLAKKLQRQVPQSIIVTTRATEDEGLSTVDSLSDFLDSYFDTAESIVFITALGVCVRLIAPHLEDKKKDPPIICMDDHARFVQSVVGGHQGGANILAKRVAGIFGAQAVLSTSSDLQEVWALDLLDKRFGWTADFGGDTTAIIARFVNNVPTALLLEVKTKGTQFLESTAPDFVEVFYKQEDIDEHRFDLLVAVSYRIVQSDIPTVSYYPKVLSLGTGCSKALDPELFHQVLTRELQEQGLSPKAIKAFGSIDIKAEQQAYLDYSAKNNLPFKTYGKEVLDKISVPNPSEVVRSKIGVDGVSESVALQLSGNTELVVEKQKVRLDNGHKFTYAIALDPEVERKPFIALVGAGPGEETLISVKGKQLLEQADCVLYAGSLIPEEMTSWCKETALVLNSATMTLEEQIEVMQSHYDKGHHIVRLHSGDPSIYGAIQEQMTLFDERGMRYFIVPGISSFNAAAAVLKSEFTIPEVVQTIIITRGAGKTPLPEAEKLEEMAKLQATLCLFLSAGIAKKVEGQLLQHYAPDTPVAVLYRLTWKDEEVHTGVLKDLAAIVKASKKTRTVLIIVGHAIHARKNRSQLYSPEWKHIFRTQKKFKLKTEA